MKEHLDDHLIYQRKSHIQIHVLEKKKIVISISIYLKARDPYPLASMVMHLILQYKHLPGNVNEDCYTNVFAGQFKQENQSGVKI